MNPKTCLLLILATLLCATKLVAQTAINVEVMPQYKGGNEQLNEDLRRYLKYPTKSKRREIQGTVYVKFDVDSNSKVQNIKIIEGITPDLDSTALAIVKFLDNWDAGTVNGKPTNVTLTLPIRFRLNGWNNAQDNQNKFRTNILTLRNKVEVCLATDSIAQLKRLISSFPDSLYPKSYEVFDFYNLTLLYLITQDYTLAADQLKNSANTNFDELIEVSDDWQKILNVYLRNNYKSVSQNLHQSTTEKGEKNILKLFIANDSLARFPEINGIKSSKKSSYNKTAIVEQQTQLGYKYVKESNDTTYNKFVRHFYIKERRLKYFSYSMAFGYAKIIHNNSNRLTYTNPNFAIFDWEFYYKKWFVVLGSNIGGSKNKIPTIIDTAHLTPKTNFENIYIQLGLGHRFYITDLFHIAPYICYNYFDVSYVFNKGKDNVVDVNKTFETNYSAGFVLKYYFVKNKYENIKPANYSPFGLTFKYSLLLPQKDFAFNKCGHYLGLSLTFNFIVPKSEKRYPYYR